MPLSNPPPADMPMLPPDALAGQVALVSGGGSGLGLAMAMAMARSGANIGIVGRSIEKLQRAVSQLEAAGAKVAIAAADVRDPQQVSAAFDPIEAAVGPGSIHMPGARHTTRRTSTASADSGRLRAAAAAVRNTGGPPRTWSRRMQPT